MGSQIDRDRVTRRVRRRLVSACTLRCGLIYLALWCFVWGALVLAARGVAGWDRLSLWWGVLLVPLIFFVAWMVGRRQAPSLAAVDAALDRSSAAGGLWMAAGETAVGTWQQRMPLVREPAIYIRAGSSHWSLGAAVVFLIAAVALPDHLFQLHQGNRIRFDEQLNRIQQQIDVLDDQLIVDGEQVVRLRDQLEQVWDLSQERDAASTWESLDYLREEVKKTAEQAAESAVADVQQAQQAQTLAEALQQDQQSPDPLLTPAQLQEAMETLADLARQLEQENQLVSQMLANAGLNQSQNPFAQQQPKQMRQVFVDQELSPEVLTELADRLRELGVDPEHLSAIDPELLAELKEATKDGKLQSDLSDALRKRLAQEQLPRDQLSALSDQQLEQIRELLQEMGIADSLYELLDAECARQAQASSAPPRLTSSDLRQLEKLAEAMGGAIELTTDQVRKLQAAGLCDSRLLKMCEAGGICDGAGLLAFLADHLADAELAVLLDYYCRGGISKGPGPAKMTWTDGSSEEGARFQEESLPHAALSALRDSQLIGISLGEPEIADLESTPSGTVLDGAQTGGGTASRQLILPRHRSAVQQYFQRD